MAGLKKHCNSFYHDCSGPTLGMCSIGHIFGSSTGAYGYVSCAPEHPGWYVWPPHNYCYPANVAFANFGARKRRLS